MPLNTSSAFTALHNVRRKLFSEFTVLKIIGIDNTQSVNPRVYLGNPITVNWNYQEQKDPTTGQVVETVFIISNQQDHLIDQATQFELVKPDGTYLRVSKTEGVIKPHSPKYQWEIRVTPNTQDFGAL